MPTLKFDSKVAAVANDALEPYVRPLFDQPGKRIMCIAELAHVERTEPAPGTEKTASVKVRIVGLEIPNADQEGYIRSAQQALYMMRTASGKLNEDGEMELSEQTIRLTGGQITYIETCRLRALLEHWSNYARRATLATGLVDSEIRHELQTVSDGLRAALAAAPLDED